MLYDPKWEQQVETKPREPWRDVLLTAATRIERMGHCKGRLRGNNGEYCVVGAIFGNPASGAHVSGTRDELEAHVRFSSHVGGDMVGWNNADERTAEEVITKLRSVALSTDKGT